MILRIDHVQTELPPPSTPDPAGAAVVQELLGGKFGDSAEAGALPDPEKVLNPQHFVAGGRARWSRTPTASLGTATT